MKPYNTKQEAFDDASPSQWIVNAYLHMAGVRLFYVLDSLEELGERGYQVIRPPVGHKLSCGCCSNGCICHNHMDIPNGFPPQKCDLHAVD